MAQNKGPNWAPQSSTSSVAPKMASAFLPTVEDAAEDPSDGTDDTLLASVLPTDSISQVGISPPRSMLRDICDTSKFPPDKWESKFKPLTFQRAVTVPNQMSAVPAIDKNESVFVEMGLSDRHTQRTSPILKSPRAEARERQLSSNHGEGINEPDRYQRVTEYYDRLELPSTQIRTSHRMPKPQQNIIQEALPPSPVVFAPLGKIPFQTLRAQKEASPLEPEEDFHYLRAAPNYRTIPGCNPRETRPQHLVNGRDHSDGYDSYSDSSDHIVNRKDGRTEHFRSARSRWREKSNGTRRSRSSSSSTRNPLSKPQTALALSDIGLALAAALRNRQPAPLQTESKIPRSQPEPPARRSLTLEDPSSGYSKSTQSENLRPSLTFEMGNREVSESKFSNPEIIYSESLPGQQVQHKDADSILDNSFYGSLAIASRFEARPPRGTNGPSEVNVVERPLRLTLE